MKENIVHMKYINYIKSIMYELGGILSARQKRQAMIVLITIIIGSGMELIGITAIMPFLQVLLQPEQMMNATYMRPFIYLFNINSFNGMLLLVGSGIIFIYIIKNVFLLFSNFVVYDYSTKIQKELSIKMLQSYMGRPYTFFMDVNSGEILRGCNDDIAGVYYVLSYIFTIISETLSVLFIGIFILYKEPVMAIVALVILSVVMISITIIFKPIISGIGYRNMVVQALKNKIIYQIFNGVKELYAMQRKELFVDDYKSVSEEAARMQRNAELIQNSPYRILEGIVVSCLIGIVLIRMMSGVDVTEFVPVLGSFAMATFKILPALGTISGRMTGLEYYLPKLHNVYETMVDTEDYEKKHMLEMQNRIGFKTDELEIVFKESVEIKNVSWRYDIQREYILDDVSICINRGESIAFIGPSGSGKTTLSDIILGLLMPQKGSVYVDGTDIYTIPIQWAKIVGYVPQAVFLIGDTVRNNVVFGLKDIDDTLIWEALEQAQLKDFVESLPQGLDTIVGERGMKFSGGQKQRIAIARALYNKPEILIMDEATAALDNETENALIEAIENLQGRITMIIVAHRLTTIRNCDAIYEIKGGKAILRAKDEVM